MYLFLPIFLFLSLTLATPFALDRPCTHDTQCHHALTLSCLRCPNSTPTDPGYCAPPTHHLSSTKTLCGDPKFAAFCPLACAALRKHCVEEQLLPPSEGGVRSPDQPPAAEAQQQQRIVQIPTRALNDFYPGASRPDPLPDVKGFD